MCHGARLAPLVQTGTEARGYAWRVEVRALDRITVQRGDPDNGTTLPPAAVTLYAVSATISWPGSFRRREVRLDTTCIGAAAAS